MTKFIHVELTNPFFIELLHLPETTRVISAEMHGDNIAVTVTDDTLHGDEVRVKYSQKERRPKKGEKITEIITEYVTDGDN